MTVDEAKALPLNLRLFSNWWWLRTSDESARHVAGVDMSGQIYEKTLSIKYDMCLIRPVITLRYNPSELSIGDKFILDGKSFTIISESKALCMSDIGRAFFNLSYDAPFAYEYEKSFVKDSIERWLKGVLTP